MSARRRRPTILDVDEVDRLPGIVYIAVEEADAIRKSITFQLREMTRGGTALLAYSNRELLVAAYGQDQPFVALSSRELPALQSQLGFNVVVLDVQPPRSPGEARQHAEDERQAAPMDVDHETGQPVVYVPSRPYRRGDAEAQLELQPLGDDQVALLTYSSRQALLDGCGPDQHYVRLPVDVLPQAMRQCGANRVLIDTSLPTHLRH